MAGLPTAYRHHAVQRGLHWTMAAIIFAALGLGLYCSYLGHGSPQRQFLMDIHKSLGMTALGLIAIRIPIRASSREPDWRSLPPLRERIASKAVHVALYLLMIVMPVSGYVTSSAEGRTVPWFGMFKWPVLLGDDRPLGRAVGIIHHYGAYTFYALLFLHLAAVIWHRMIKKDEVLSRML
nr:cytochrome b [Neorhizobium alkalisoli]